MSAGTVALVVIADMPLYELSIACEVFGVQRTDLADPWYELRRCAVRPGQVRTELGALLSCPYGLDELATADTVVVPAIPQACLDGERDLPQPLIDALRDAHAAGARMVSLCSGAFALAAAGLLDGRQATTHWMHTGELARLYPDVRVDASVLYVDEGDVLTSAGRSAGLDLCLHLVREDLGATVANQVARRMVVPAHRPGGQLQYIDTSVPDTDDESLAPVLQWADAHLDRPLTVPQLARHARMSTRTFIRRFHAATGTTPLRWLLNQRVVRARALLESTNLSIDQVSAHSGLGTAANLRRHFHISLGVTPTEYRRTYHDRQSVQTGSAKGSGQPGV